MHALKQWGEMNRGENEIKGMSERDRWSGGREEDEQEVDRSENERGRHRAR